MPSLREATDCDYAKSAKCNLKGAAYDLASSVFAR